jgi:hypothetical protein
MVALRQVTVSGSSTASVNFDLTGITGYTDLFVSIQGGGINSGVAILMQLNGVANSSSYSDTYILGNGSSASSGRQTQGQYTPYALRVVGRGTGVTQDLNNMGTVHIMNYANNTTNKTVLIRSSIASYGAEASVGMFASTSPITTITFLLDNGNFVSGSTFSLYGIANADIGAYATGGIITQDSTYYYHAFGSSGTFTPSQALTADILVVAGGGGGGYDGGGGGAGGIFAATAQSLTSGTGYTCTVGAGGAGKASAGGTGTIGSNSQFASLTAATGGGGGGSQNSDGASGASGGGAGRSGSAHAGGTATNGNAGGVNTTSSQYNGGGGGGFGTAGAAGIASKGGNGGDGVNTYSTWLSATGLGVSGYIAAGGGAGGSDGSGSTAAGVGGLGGGGNGGFAAIGFNAVASSGSGGGGGGFISGSSTLMAGGSGGSGLIIVRYAK